LRHVLSEVRITIHLPQRRRINKIQMPLDQFSEGILGLPLGVSTQQLSVIQHRHLQM
jgi:hypothetical protein